MGGLTEYELDFMEGRFSKEHQGLSPFFTRKPYAGTKAEPGMNKSIEEEIENNEQDSI